jgi:hypothetical protein
MSPKKFDPPSAVKHILKRLNKTLDPGGAKKIIMDINYNPSKSIAATGYFIVGLFCYVRSFLLFVWLFFFTYALLAGLRFTCRG